MEPNQVNIGQHKITIEALNQIACGRSKVQLSTDPKWLKKIDDSAALVRSAWMGNKKIYGVTTGYGASVTREIPPNLIEELPQNLIRFHGCGTGAEFDQSTTRAIIAARLISLATGASGIRKSIMDRLCDFINLNLLPIIPEEGSVGASGDLTPLSYIAAAVVGERELIYQGQRSSAKTLLDQLGLLPLKVMPKEALSMMNGTSVMTALACLAYERAMYLGKISSRITAMAIEGLMGNRSHFDQRLFELKPHPGQSQAAKWIREDLNYQEATDHGRWLQERYSIRCAPHVIGVLMDALPWMKTQIETELNSANDNPVIDENNTTLLHGGHFYGGHIAFVMDSLKVAVANISDLLDRQLAILVDDKYNQGLPSNLSGSASDRLPINHGLKAVQISASAWTAEALKLTMPASVFSRSTECHNQDKVSMGTISARDCLRVLQLTEQTAAALLLATSQAIDLRIKSHELKITNLSDDLREMLSSIRGQVAFLDQDRALESDLRQLTMLIQTKYWALYNNEKGCNFK
jgi:histidine ammonia-lyase